MQSFVSCFGHLLNINVLTGKGFGGGESSLTVRYREYWHVCDWRMRAHMLHSAPLKCLLDQRTMLRPTRVISLFNETRRVDFLQRHRYHVDRIVCAEQDSIDFRRVENPNRRCLLFCAGGGCEMETHLFFLALSSCSCWTIRLLSCETDGLGRIYHSCRSSRSVVEILFSWIVQGNRQISTQKTPRRYLYVNLSLRSWRWYSICACSW